MITYDALMGEIAAIESARDSLPRNIHVCALFELAISRLSEQADAIKRARRGAGETGDSDEDLRLAS
jgi:hypothetical protein